MKFKTLAVALALTIAPTLSMAECNWGKDHQAMSCATGTSFDAETGKCVPVTT